MNASNAYDRAAGYFSSTLYAIVGVPLAAFAGRGGRMRLVCSPKLSETDIAAMDEGYHEKGLADALLRDLEAMVAEPVAETATKLLATLVAQEVLEIRIAFRPGEKQLYHDKVGLFKDSAGDRVSFSGSANETWNAWSNRGNFEGFHAHRSWVEEDHVAADVDYFERLWTNTMTGLVSSRFLISFGSCLIARADSEGLESAQLELDRKP